MTSNALLQDDSRLLLELGVGPLDLELEVVHLSLSTSKVSDRKLATPRRLTSEDDDVWERCQKDDDDEEGRVKRREGRESKGTGSSNRMEEENAPRKAAYPPNRRWIALPS